MDTKWLKISGFNYEVSNTGEVRNNKTKKILKQGLDSRGYYRVSFSLGKKGTPKIAFIHRLVAEQFIDNPEAKEQVNHKNGNKLDNHVENLEWVTPKENVHHAIRTGLFKTKEISKKATEASLLVNSKPVVVYEKINDKNTYYKSISECSRKTGISHSTISGAIKNSRSINGMLFNIKN